MRGDRGLGNRLHTASIHGGTRFPLGGKDQSRFRSQRGDAATYLADNVESGTSVTAEIRTGGDRTMGHDWGRNVRLDEHAVRQRGVGGLVLLRGQGIQDGSINSQGTYRGPSGGGGRRGSRVDTSGRVGILITFGGDASEKGASRSIVGVAVRA